MIQRILCRIFWFRHRTVQMDGGYYCDRCRRPRPGGW
jgi:hypothetical protein